ncbi:MAG: hypothetical protein LBN18_04090, partial [Dysgonamonadaceae bacterium]|nr:hypothetical protein [Dysgonamonadaceae bacterium]
RQVFNISLKADIALSLSVVANFYYYILTEDYNTVNDLNVNCFSLLKIVGSDTIPSWLILAYNSINLFELAYLLLLILLIRTSFQLNYLKSTVFVFLTYGVGNYLYLVAMTFLYLYFN